MANTKITSRVLADNAVLTANITDANVTTAKVADNAVTGDKIADDVALAGNPTTTTQSAGNNTTRIATTAFVSTAVANLADSAPDALNTLNELAAAMGDDANFSTTVTNSIAAKLPLAGGTITGATTLTTATAAAEMLNIVSTHASGIPILTLKGAHSAQVRYQDENGNNQARIDFNDGGQFKFIDATDGSAKLEIDANGLDFHSNNLASVGTISSGAITSTGGSNVFEQAKFGSSSSDNSQVTIGYFDANATNGLPALLNGSDFGGLIQGGENGKLVLGIRDNDAADSLDIVSGSGNFMSDSTYDKVVATFKADGNVGIGTTDPTAPLHVTRTASGYPILKLTQNGADQYNTIYLQNSNSTAATVVMGTGGSSVTNTSWANSAVFGTTSDAKVVLLQNDSAAVTVDTNQNVGIGQTSNLNARLNVTVDSGNEGIQVYRAFGGNGGGYNGVAFAMGNSASASNVHVYSSIVPNIISNTDGSEDGSIAFYTSLSGTNAEKMRLNNNGQLLLGTTSNNSDTYKIVADLGGGSKGIDVRGISYNANNGAFRSVPSGNTTYLFAAMLNSSNSTVGSIVVTSADTTYNTSSDYRLKENITPLENGLDRLNQLKPVNFNWIESGKEDEGFIAHEVKEVFPYAVTGEKDAVNEEGKIQGQQMDYGRITPLLVKAIQEQQEQIETLKKEVEELKGG